MKHYFSNCFCESKLSLFSNKHFNLIFLFIISSVFSFTSFSQTTNQPPTLTLQVHARDTIFAGTFLVMTTQAYNPDGPSPVVEYFYNGTNKMGQGTENPYTTTWVFNNPGRYTITAKATDNLGASTMSAPFELTVINCTELPQITFFPEADSIYTAPANLSIEAYTYTNCPGRTISRVDFQLTDHLNPMELLKSDVEYPYNVTLTDLAAGNYTLMATAYDNTGVPHTFSKWISVKGKELLIPGVIEAEDYQAMFGVAIEKTTDDTGKNVGWIDKNDWLDYKVNAKGGGFYEVQFRIASTIANSQFQVLSGAAVLATITTPNTGGWQKWITLTTRVVLPAGVQTLRLKALTNGFNLNWMGFKYIGFSAPGLIEAEGYAAMSGVKAEPTADAGGGQNVGWLDANDWIEYNVNVQNSSGYAAIFRVASWVSNAQLQVKLGTTTLCIVNIPNTGGGQIWKTVMAGVSLPAGIQKLRIVVINGGFNLNNVQLAPPPASARLGSDELVANKEITLFPNPTPGHLKFKGIEEGATIIIKNSIGTEVLTAKLKGTSLDISSLQAGKYLVIIDEIIVKTVIKE